MLYSFIKLQTVVNQSNQGFISTPHPTSTSTFTFTQAEWRKKLHPLPDRPFPATLPAAAASKTVPQALSLKVWHGESAQRPEGLYLRWNAEKEDPHAPPMDSYFIYVAEENPDASFSQWTQIGHVPAAALPMGCHLSGFGGYRRLCFAVVGKDQFGRYGPYSQVESVCAKSAKANKKQ